MLDSESEDYDEKIVINKKFADKFAYNQRQNELKNVKKHLKANESEDESDSETEDDDAELLTTKLDVNIVKTINSIKKRDPKIYDANSAWFDDNEDDDGDNASKTNTTKPNQKVKYKDVLRNQLLAHGADIENEEIVANPNKFVYNKEQEIIRNEIINAGKFDKFRTFDECSNDGDDDSDDDLLKPLEKKTNEEVEIEEAELKNALNDLNELAGDDNAEEKFLTDYLSQKRWKDKTSKQQEEKVLKKNTEVEIEAVDDEQDEVEVEKMEKFETSFNFRFEELESRKETNSMQVIGHSRNVNGSIRRVDDKRKASREAKAERKEKEKRQKEAELRRLKNLKRQELTDRLKRIAQVGGVEKLDLIDESILDEDWDPLKHEMLMQKEFGDEYYAQDDGQVFNSEIFFRNDEDENFDYDKHVKKAAQDYTAFDDGVVDKDENYNDVENIKKERKRKGKKKQKRLNDDNNVGKEGVEYGDKEEEQKRMIASKVDELLYKLDYEDVVGGLQCRFKYNTVDQQDFGLTVEDILLAEDKELNQFVSLKHITAPKNTSSTSNNNNSNNNGSNNNESYNGLNERSISKKRKRLRKNVKDRMLLLKAPNVRVEKVEGYAEEEKVELQDDVAELSTTVIKVDENKSKKPRKRKRKTNSDTAI